MQRSQNSISDLNDPLLSEDLDDDILSTPSKRPWYLSQKAKAKRAHVVTIAGAVLTVTSLVAASVFFFVAGQRHREAAVEERLEANPIELNTSNSYSEWLNGPPTQSFRDNLRNDTKYMTVWAPGGWTNDVMSLFNILYVAVISERVAVMPPFAPSHLPQEAGFINFGDVFDVPGLVEGMKHPVVEWWEVKETGSTTVDEVGCWSIWASSQNDDPKPRPVPQPGYLNIDASYTSIPNEAKVYPSLPGDWHVKMWALAALTFPDYRKYHLGTPFPSQLNGHSLPPDEHMACFDFAYFVCATHGLEYEFDYSPAWRFVGKYARWNPNLLGIAHELLRGAFELEPEDEIPPYVAVHVRRGDFHWWCHETPANECFAPPSAFARRVAEVQQELLETKGVDASRVLVTSDETDPAWWSEIKSFGWTWVNHTTERTGEKYGLWYTVTVDAVFQSIGAGFVGTDQSTMSLLAARRTQDWYGGATRRVKWGHLGADDH
ncbi:hypothetical protein BD410DRAFT_780825 [Rickenella mellea]|uniref:GDP-fucose protein O-fucosyltransferase 2 n=1 Tax=Rickenella mellea TaxID=50990 RepID=A0A4Y7QL01_9AGAM|nr:hypothetical protein BD410DRAFT_780825 [Rickenella mellea]